MTHRLYRLPEQGKIAGIAAGFAEYLAIDVTLIRLLFIAAIFVSGGAAVIIYIILAFVIPVKGENRNEHFDLNERVGELASEVRQNGNAERMGNYTGIALILIGIWFLLVQFLPDLFVLQWSVIWPCLVIVLGILIVVRGRK